MTIKLRQKALENDNISLYLDIYDKGKRKFEYLSLYLLPEINEEIKARNDETLRQAHLIRAERILHPETIQMEGMKKDKSVMLDTKSPEVIEWIESYIEWMKESEGYSKSIVQQTLYLQKLLNEFLKSKRRQQLLLKKFDKKWVKEFISWLVNDYVPQKYVRVEPKPLSKSSVHNLQRRLICVLNKAVMVGKIKTNPFYQLDSSEYISKPQSSHKQYLTPEEIKLFMSSEESSPGVIASQKAFGFACLTGLRISDIKALKWSDIVMNEGMNTLTIVQQKTKALNTIPICSTALGWLPEKGTSDYVFNLPASANVDAALKRIAKKCGIDKNISFHTSRHTFGTLIQWVTGNIETTKKLMGHKSLKSTSIYADVLTDEKIKATNNVTKAFKTQKPNEENKTIPKTKRTAAIMTHARKINEM